VSEHRSESTVIRVALVDDQQMVRVASGC